MKFLKILIFLLFVVFLTNCDNTDNPVDPVDPQKKDCEKNNYGYIQFDNRTDKVLDFFNTKDVVTPLHKIPAYNTLTVCQDTMDRFFYKLSFLNCSIHDKYGVFTITQCDTLFFTILGNADVVIK